MKRFSALALCIVLIFAVVGCGKTVKTDESDASAISSISSASSEAESGSQLSVEENSSDTSVSEKTDSGNASSTSTGSIVPNPQTPTNASVKIFLAGDSTVKTYDEKQYIGGWGQFLQCFFNDDVAVINKAEGGRSTRSFINEGRLFTMEKYASAKYTSIESEISAGDYLFIQFGHNDDATRTSYDTYIDRQVPVGEADDSGVKGNFKKGADGKFPTGTPVKKPTNELPQEFVDFYTGRQNGENEINSARQTAAKYGDEYYSYESGYFKGYLKMYVDFARERGAIPVLVTPVARVKFDSAGKTIIGAKGSHGVQLEYVEAVRELAEEENVLLIDAFAATKELLETCEKAEANYLMALKPNSLTGNWPNGYDETYGNSAAGYTGIEATHYNKFGAYLTAAKIAESLKAMADSDAEGKAGEKISFAFSMVAAPSFEMPSPSLLGSETVEKLYGLYTWIKP